MYNKINWIDEVKDTSGQILQKGTPLSSKNMNNIENGTHASNIGATEAALQIAQLKRDVRDLEGEIGVVNLKNTNKYPFNNSIKTIAMKKARNTIDYRVVYELISSDGAIGEVIITDKQLNGFKIEYTGSAANVAIKYYIQGGL